MEKVSDNTIFSKFSVLLLCVAIIPFFSACFTGIESTKQIEVSRQDRKLISPSEEDLLLATVKGTLLKDWYPNYPFIIADSKANLLINPNFNAPQLKAGDLIFFKESNQVIMPDGNSCLRLIFADKAGNLFKYNTGKSSEDALNSVSSDKIPMAIDINMVRKADSLMSGIKVWNRSPLAYLKSGERVNVLKYSPVVIDSVTYGTAEFPLKVWSAMEVKKSFSSDTLHQPIFFFLDFNSSLAESRPMAKLFQLSDPKAQYPAISDKVWNIIRAGNVAIGMTKEECKLSLGNPSDANSGHDYNSTIDLWQYPDGTFLRFIDGVLVSFRK